MRSGTPELSPSRPHTAASPPTRPSGRYAVLPTDGQRGVVDRHAALGLDAHPIGVEEQRGRTGFVQRGSRVLPSLFSALT